MMMSKPAPTKPQEAEVKPAVKKSPQDSIADLERRLAQLTPNVPVTTTTEEEPPSFAAPPSTTTASDTAAQAAAPMKSGKNALLARIMAAQERAKQAQHPSVAANKEETPPPYSEDLLLMEDAKPLAFDAMLLPPPGERPPPPMFDESLLPPPQETRTAASASTLIWDPHAPTIASPPPPSAPDFEDLLDAPQPSRVVMPPPPPPATMDQDAIEAILGMEGLSDVEKQQLLEEQKQILAAIEADKANTQVSVASARADAFEQRSTSAAIQALSGDTVVNSNGQVRPRSVQIGKDKNIPLHGVELTKRAIQDGTAITVKCLACDNWMQVTKAATLMFCPVCQTVSPVVIPEDGSEAKAAKQVDSDLELAEKLQQEEYEKAAQDGQRRDAQAGAAAATAAPKKADASSQGWMEWLGLSSPSTATTSSPERPTTFSQGPAERGYMGVSLPPGASASSPSRSPSTRSPPNYPDRLLAAQTETISFEEDDSLLVGRARVAEQKPLFSCVADSITSAATSLYATTLTEDAEGNVHGVDSSSLLAVPNIRRGEEEQKKSAF